MFVHLPRERKDKYTSIRKRKRKGFCGPSSKVIDENCDGLATQEGNNLPTTPINEGTPSTSNQHHMIYKKHQQGDSQLWKERLLSH